MGEIVYIYQDRVITDSLMVSDVFGKEHKNVIRDINKQIEKLKEAGEEEFSRLNFEQSEYTNERGKTYIKYLLTEDAFTMITMSYTTVEAMKFKVKYINEFKRMRDLLGNKNSRLPSTFSEALRLAADLQEEKEKLEKQNKLLKPKADSHDHFLDSKNNRNMEATAKALKVGRNNLFKFLREDEIKIMGKGKTIPYQKYIDAGYFVVVETPKNGFSVSQTYVTKDGVEYLSKKIRKHFMKFPYMMQYASMINSD